MHFLILLLTSFSCCLSSLAMVLLSLMSLVISSSPLSVFLLRLLLLLHSSILPLESSFLLFLLPSVLVLLPRLLRVHPTLLLSFGTSFNVCLVLVLLHFLSASVWLLRFLFRSFLTLHSSSSYRSSIGFLSSCFSFSLSWIMLHSLLFVFLSSV